MKNASPALTELLKKGHAVKALPEVVADWNLNRYHDTNTDNAIPETNAAFDAEIFPIESIAEPLRPGKGINKARVGQSTVSREHYNVGGGMDARFYVADPDDEYKYWTSPKPAVNGVMPLFNATNFPSDEYADLTGYDNQTSARPYIEYGEWDEEHENFTAGKVAANKVFIALENSWATPDDFDIVITRVAENGNTSTVTISNEDLSPGWEASGQIVIRWNGTSWVHNGTIHTDSRGFPLVDNIRRIQLVVRTLKGGYQPNGAATMYLNVNTNTYKATDGKDSFLDLIEMGAHLEADLSDWTISTGDTFEMGEVSNLYPIGTITANQGNISLSNIYPAINGEPLLGTFQRENTDPDIPWLPYIDANTEINLRYAFYDDSDNLIEKVQQFKMYVDDWSNQSGDTVDVTLSDYSKFFNETMVPAALWEGLKVPEIIWRVMDSVGYTNYQVDQDVDRVVEHEIPVFYTNGESSVWEVLDDLAKASQTAIYIDGNGTLQVKTRDFALSAIDGPVWKLQSYNDEDYLENIVEATQTGSFEPNSIKVIYQKTKWSKMIRGMPAMQKVWEPEDENVVLRATPLARDLGLDDNFIWIDPKEVRIWPYEGMVNIQGELIKYKGKQYAYYTGTQGTERKTALVTSEDERKNVRNQKSTPGYNHKAHFTGGLRIARDEFGRKERGAWNSEPRTHNVEANGYSVRRLLRSENGVYYGTNNKNTPGFKQLKHESKVELKTGTRFNDYHDLLVATRGNPTDNAFFHYGTRFKFVRGEGNKHQTAGMVIHSNGPREDGYYFEMTISKRLGGKERKNMAELIVYSRVDGKHKRLGKKDLAIGENIEYEMDITYINKPNSTDHRLQVWVNGKNCLTMDVSGPNRNAAGGRFGLFARGSTQVQFEYLYAIRRAEPEPSDDFSFLDRVEKGFDADFYRGNRWDREWVYGWRKVKRRKKKRTKRDQYRFNRQFFDEFGPIVHEIREYDVKFDPAPVLHSRLYLTNDWQGACLEYRADPFGAKFVLANTARHNAVVHGEDKLSYAGTDQAINHVLTVLGRALVIDEAEEVLAENTDQIRARGKIEAELSSEWIQSKAMANDVADWIRKNFTYGNEGLVVETFGNPLIEIGDVVHVDYPDKHLSGDYFVVSVNTEFDSGITTTLTLRRRV